MIEIVEGLNFLDIFVTFLALLGPQKILLSFDEASRGLTPRQGRFLAVTSSVAAAAVGVVVTPLGVTAVLVEALSGAGLAWRTAVAAGYVAVAALDLACVL